MRPRPLRSFVSLSLLIASLLLSPSAFAELGGFVAFTGANIDTIQTVATGTPPNFTYITSTTATKIYGPTFGLFADTPTPVVKFGFDLRGQLLNGNGSQHYSGMLGPRLKLSLPVIAFKPYVEFLVGIGSYNTSASTRTDIHADYEGVVGLDRKIIPLVDWRILEFTYANYYGGSIPTKALSTGLVLRLP